MQTLALSHSAASFSHRHTLRHRKPQCSFLLRPSPPHFFYFNPTTKNFVPFHFKFAKANIRQSRNGLLLLEFAYRDYYIYNPTTGESRNLFLRYEYFLDLHLEFDPSKSPHYRVVCLRPRNCSIDEFFEIEVYDSEMHTWKRGEKVYHHPFHLLYDRLCWKFFTYFIGKIDGRVRCFDIEKDIYKMSPVKVFCVGPQAQRLHIFSLVESGGHVHCIAVDDIANYSVMCEITEKGCDELLNCIADFYDFSAQFSAVVRDRICFIGIIRGEGEEESMVFLFPGKIMVYNFYAGRLEELEDLRAHEFHTEGRYEAYHFFESLAPV